MASRLPYLACRWHEAGSISGNRPLTCINTGGRYWVRTSDLFGVNEARYHCANRPCGLRPKP
ncbi:hypothetical protein NOCA2760002 [metagenome]|uniref:Uncharacterized protein n=1 Tax=metagenome TaxID=256318 RepID=A0A2P2CEG0_9ZZZZ